ncbi:hypothetical protein M3Y98_00887800 [Aphelenchoides besseyi]|nr:hypothetical protein M3Y98_00887800 [Aphelenchoides besseyi]KAI6192961.1 hypothetical protein M3Y96_00967800 [Aphelenchoides besseyi]
MLFLLLLTIRLVDSLNCPDNVEAIAECETQEDCLRFDLNCTKLADDQSFCCASKDEPPEETCYDNLGECGRKARLCHLNAYRRLMIKFCPLSCGLCHEALSRQAVYHSNPIAICRDTHAACESRQFMCKSKHYHTLMKRNCQFTCGMC